MTNDPTEQRIPLIAEEAVVTKAETVTAHVRVRTTVEERPVLINETIERGDLRVERIAVEQAVDAAPAPRQEGDTLIVPIVEERLVIEKRLFVVEELRITRTSTIERVSIPETLRTMRATVDQVPVPSSPGSDTNG